MAETTSEVQDIIIGNELGRKKMTIRVGMEDVDDGNITLPAAVWNYGALVSALVRHKYSESDVEAILSNSLQLLSGASEVSEEETTEKTTEYNEFQGYREKCKARAKELLQLGEEMGLTEMYG